MKANDLFEIVINKDDGSKSIGEKRNECLDLMKGEYFDFIDDDDEVTPIYCEKMIQAAKSGADCASLTGLYYENGVFIKPFVHDLKYREWNNDNPSHYERCPNHLNLVAKRCIEGMRFNSISFGEDGQWSMQLLNEGRLKTQYEIKEVLYHYYHRSK